MNSQELKILSIICNEIFTKSEFENVTFDYSRGNLIVQFEDRKFKVTVSDLGESNIGQK